MAESPSLVMPDFKYQWDLKPSKRHSTLVIRAKNGRQQRFGNYPTAGYRYFSGSTQFLNQDQRRQLADFMDSVRGALVPFYFFLPVPRNYVSFALGTVATSSTFIVPFKDFAAELDVSPSTFTITVAGISKAFTVQSGVGAQTQDQITFSAGAQTGAVVGTFSGRPMFTGHFDMDEAVEQMYQNAASILTAVSVRIEEVL